MIAIWLGAVLGGIIGFTIAIVRYIFWPLTTRRVGNGRRWVKCLYCTAGATYLSVKGWSRIPVAIRIVRDGHPIFEAPLGNVRGCQRCNGMGGHWHDISAEELEGKGQDGPAP